MAKENATNAAQGAPTLEPPDAAQGASTTQTGERPQELDLEQLASAASYAGATPRLAPPEQALVTEGVTAVHSDKRINALFCTSQTRNAWVSVQGVGWKKLSNTSDSALGAMTMLGAHAKQLGCRVDYRDEADGMIHELYVW